MRIGFRVDGSTEIGLGHVIRCLTLAQHFTAEHDVYFLCRDLPTHVASLLDEANITLISLDALTKNDTSCFPAKTNDILDNHRQLTHAKLCISAVQNVKQEAFDALVIDHYQLSETFESAMLSVAPYIVVIDDLANRSHYCHLLIDQNFYFNSRQRYNNLLPQFTDTLLGPQYAILRKEFFELQTQQKQVNHLLVCFGGSDPENVTGRVVDALLNLTFLDFSAEVIVGAGYPFLAKLKAQLSQQKKITLTVNCKNMAEVMSKATIMIGAGGSMHWERAKLHVAGFIITIADNQVETTRCLHQNQCCVWIGRHTDITDIEIRESIETALRSPELVQQVADNALELIGFQHKSSFVADEIKKRIKR